MLQQIGISHTVAKELMAIGANPAITNGRNCDHFPNTIRALYELSRLSDRSSGVWASTELISAASRPGSSPSSRRTAAGRYRPTQAIPPSIVTSSQVVWSTSTWLDPVNWSTANESRSSVGTGGSIAGRR